MLLRLLGTYGTIIVLVVMIVVFAVLQPGTFATVGNFRNILNDMAIGTIVAAGLTVPLVAGDVICTGTCAGVGAGRGTFLADGDVMVATIDAIGRLENRVALKDADD